MGPLHWLRGWNGGEGSGFGGGEGSGFGSVGVRGRA